MITCPRPAALLPLLLLGACTALGPDPTVAPQTAVPARFVEGGTAPLGEVAGRAFWADYRDTTLSDLVARGLSRNLDVLAANERIRAAEADLRAAGVLSSQVGGSSAVLRERTGGDGVPDANVTTASLSAGFVFDLFGGAFRTRQAAAAGVQGAQAQAEATRLAWLAELVAAYSDARYYQQALALTRTTIAARQRTVDITRQMVDVGTANRFDLAQAEAQLATVRADLPSFEAMFNAQVFRIATLLDEPAGPILTRLQRGAPQLRTPSGPGQGVPADLLRSRPDVRAAEHGYTAAVAAVGVATAEMLPSLSLTGRVSDIASTTSWGFGPQLSLPIFNQGALQAARERRVSEARQAEIAWRASVSAAVEDVQRGQSNLRRFIQRVGMLEAAVAAQDQAYQMALANFEAGTLPLLSLLDVDRALAAARLGLASARNDAAKQWAALQIATGAGARVGQ